MNTKTCSGVPVVGAHGDSWVYQSQACSLLKLLPLYFAAAILEAIDYDVQECGFARVMSSRCFNQIQGRKTLRDKENAAFFSGDINAAVNHFVEAISLANHVCPESKRAMTFYDDDSSTSGLSEDTKYHASLSHGNVSASTSASLSLPRSCSSSCCVLSNTPPQAWTTVDQSPGLEIGKHFAS
ncbi:unnamed protein product [Arabis nemorensis]|uniref:Uncharacterized protein n=1 Tax=Arabis nemorensis TaxID=586526 RepID=A0A565CBY7_9BRAS|nr:unnamed protein product [Arabis nemorensis]